ncbi:hydratase [Saccharobesus litoralis]|uniref:Hydratase n=1 Tax=Saccharobesus litoralis TaxID=2172099 RepID=A0A2S0VLD7_9ALTE|nr:hydratase [Saccharobesus litoralis]AWB65017.1 hydratase [Saccharobesus litoralis]
MSNPLQAANELLSRRVAGTKAPRLDESIRPTSLDDVFAIHAEMSQQLKVGGWKCLLPPAEGKVIAAPIFENSKQSGASCELFADNDCARLEPEITFILGKDLPAKEGGYSESEIKEAISSTHMALELMQARYATDSQADYFEKLADCMVNQGLFIGPELDKQAAFNANEMTIKVNQPGDDRAFSGVHPNGQADKPLYWFVNYMSERGIDLLAGQAIITGSFCGIVEVAFDQPTTISYEGLGEYQVQFTAKA